ncbi:MAG: hypothetical protein FJ146_05400 [Deltaproteobacteria bacterium]|nr:hypothetical protein [Deltaproteobacteria bacterium]
MKCNRQQFAVFMTFIASLSLGSAQARAEVGQSEMAATNLVRAHFRSLELDEVVSRMRQLTDRLGEREPLRQAPARLSKNLANIRAETDKALAHVDDSDLLKSSEIVVKSTQAGMIAILAAIKLRLSQLDLLSADDKATLDKMIGSIQNLTLPRNCEIEG